MPAGYVKCEMNSKQLNVEIFGRECVARRLVCFVACLDQILNTGDSMGYLERQSMYCGLFC